VTFSCIIGADSVLVYNLVPPNLVVAVVGEFAKTGWVAYPPLSELQFSPGVGVDYYPWALQISGIGTFMTGINFVTTILKTRAPGMGYMRMPVFCWTALHWRCCCSTVTSAFTSFRPMPRAIR
jgi:heme/copper-type cytochrome/quinol oxidase subunit 1